MKSNAVFYIDEGIIKFFQVSFPKLVTGIDLLDCAQQNDAQISQTLSDFVKTRKLNFAESRVTVLVPRSRVILRSMVFPSHKEEEIRSMIDLQVGSSIPFAREEVEIDFQVLTKSADGYAKAAVVIIPQETAMRYWKIFSDSKIPVHGLTVSSIGLWLLYNTETELSDKPAAIIDLDLSHSEICLCDKTHWITSREIPAGLLQMQQAGHAEILKQWELTQRNSGEKSASPVESVYLAGTTDGARALGEAMTKPPYNLAVKEIDLTRKLSLARDLQWPKALTEQGVSLAPLAGIALSNEAVPINLIPTAVREDQQQRSYQRQLILLGVWIAAGLISLGLALGVGFIKKHFQLAQLQNKLHATKQDAMDVEDQLQKIHDIEYMLNNRLVFADLAGQLYRSLPAQVYLVSISITDGNTLSFQGVSSNPVDINQFQKNMVDSQKFSNVGLDYVNKRITQQGEVDYFKITCTLKPAGGQK